MIEKCIAKFSRNHYWKKVTYKTQEIIAKCLKQFDLRLFEEIGGNIQEKKVGEEMKKNTFRASASRAKKSWFFQQFFLCLPSKTIDVRKEAQGGDKTISK